MGEESPVCLAIKKVSELFDFDKELNFHIYSHKEENDFKSLWDLLDLKVEGQSIIIIVWDGYNTIRIGDVNNSSKF